MITIATADLVGLLNDVLPFAHPEEDLPQLNCVQLEWDGDMLHALTTDLHRIAISSWHPNDDLEGGERLDLVNPFGGADRPWKLLLPLDSAQQIAQKFKLPAKLGLAPLTIAVDQKRMTVRRLRAGGLIGLRIEVDGADEVFPDVRAELAEHTPYEPVKGISFNATFLADFAKVRPRAPLMLGFCGLTGLTHVRIGKRFAGSIRPTTLGERRVSQSGSASAEH